MMLNSFFPQHTLTRWTAPLFGRLLLLASILGCSSGPGPAGGEKSAVRPVQGYSASVAFLKKFLRDPDGATFSDTATLMSDEDTSWYTGKVRAINTFGGWEVIDFDLRIHSGEVVGGKVGEHYLTVDRMMRRVYQMRCDSIARLPKTKNSIPLLRMMQEYTLMSAERVDADKTSPFKTVPYLPDIETWNPYTPERMKD